MHPESVRCRAQVNNGRSRLHVVLVPRVALLDEQSANGRKWILPRLPTCTMMIWSAEALISPSETGSDVSGKVKL